MSRRDPALDDISVLNDPSWTPPTANDIADWSRTAIKILSLSDNLGEDLNHILADSQRVRSSIVLKRSSVENEFNSMDRELNSQLAAMPESIEGMNVLLKKNRQKEIAERQTREMLIADGFMDPEQAKEVLEDDAALVEIGSKRLKQLLTPVSEISLTSSNADSIIHEEDSLIYQTEEEGSLVNNSNHDRRNNDRLIKNTKSRRRRKRGKKKKSNGKVHRESTFASSPPSSSSSITNNIVPSVESNLDASSRILSIMEAERKREIFRQETLSSLKGSELVQMEKIFIREKKQAEKMISQMLVEYIPRPISKKSSPTKQQAKQSKARYKPSKMSSLSLSNTSKKNGSVGLVQQMRTSMGRGQQKNFNTANLLPGAALDVQPPAIPDDVNTDTLHLTVKEHTNEAGEPVDSGLRVMVKEHTSKMDLTFPEIEKYKKPGQEYARYLEKNL
jgi:hypothetical protein